MSESERESLNSSGATAREEPHLQQVELHKPRLDLINPDSQQLSMLVERRSDTWIQCNEADLIDAEDHQ